MDFAHFHVSHQVVALFAKLMVFGLLALALTVGNLSGATKHTLTDEETVVAGQDAARATLVAGAKLEEVDVLNLFVLDLFQELNDVVDFVDGVGVLGIAEATLTVGQRGQDTIGGEL